MNPQYQEHLFTGQIFVLQNLFQQYPYEVIYNMACDVNSEITSYVQTLLYNYSPEYALHMIQNRIKEENIRKQHLIELQSLKETVDSLLMLSEKEINFNVLKIKR